MPLAKARSRGMVGKSTDGPPRRQTHSAPPRRATWLRPTDQRGSQDDREAQFPTLPANRARGPVPNHGERPCAQRTGRPRAQPRRATPPSAASTSTPSTTPARAKPCSTEVSPAPNVGLGRSVMPALTTGVANVALGDKALFRQHQRRQQRRHRQRRAVLQHHRRLQRCRRHLRAPSNTIGTNNAAAGNTRWEPTRPATTTSPPGRAGFNTTGDDNVATGFRRSSNTAA